MVKLNNIIFTLSSERWKYAEPEYLSTTDRGTVDKKRKKKSYDVTKCDDIPNISIIIDTLYAP